MPPSEAMPEVSISGLKLGFIMTGLCLAVLLTGMVSYKPVKPNDANSLPGSDNFGNCGSNY